MAPMTIRPAGPEDEDDVTALYLQLRDHHRALQPESIRYRVADEGWRHVTRGAIEDGRVWVAGSDGEVVGFMKLAFAEKPWGVSCEIETLVVGEGHRYAGVGKALMRSAEQIARDRGARGLRVDVLMGNTEALRFYRDLGFEDTAIRLAFNL